MLVLPLLSPPPHTIIHPQCRIIKYQHLCCNGHGESGNNFQNKLVNGFFLRTLLLQIYITQFKCIYHEWTAFTILLIHSMTEYNHLCSSILFFTFMVTCNSVFASRSPESLCHVTRTEIVKAKQIFLNGMYEEKEIKQIKNCLCGLTKQFNSRWFWQFKLLSVVKDLSSKQEKVCFSCFNRPTHYQPRMLVTVYSPGFFHEIELNETRRKENKPGSLFEVLASSCHSQQEQDLSLHQVKGQGQACQLLCTCEIEEVTKIWGLTLFCFPFARNTHTHTHTESILIIFRFSVGKFAHLLKFMSPKSIPIMFCEHSQTCKQQARNFGCPGMLPSDMNKALPCLLVLALILRTRAIFMVYLMPFFSLFALFISYFTV